jgi:hypothetical protein
MRSNSIICVVLALAATAYAKDPKPYQSGSLQQMDSVPCSAAEIDAQIPATQMLGTDTGSEQTRQLNCQEYVLQADRVTYRIRPRDEKHPVLLPVGEPVQFRLQKDKVLLRVREIDSKEREYIVVSMTPRSDGSTADATPTRLNHLQ